MNGLEIVGAITLTVLAIVIVILTIVLLVRVIIAKKALREREKSDERVYKSLLSEINKTIPIGVVKIRWVRRSSHDCFPNYSWGYVEINDRRWFFGSMLWYSKAKSFLKDKKIKVKEFVFS